MNLEHLKVLDNLDKNDKSELVSILLHHLQEQEIETNDEIEEIALEWIIDNINTNNILIKNFNNIKNYIGFEYYKSLNININEKEIIFSIKTFEDEVFDYSIDKTIKVSKYPTKYLLNGVFYQVSVPLEEENVILMDEDTDYLGIKFILDMFENTKVKFNKLKINFYNEREKIDNDYVKNMFFIKYNHLINEID